MWLCCCGGGTWYALAKCGSDGVVDWAVTAAGSTTGASTQSGAGAFFDIGVDSSDNIYGLSNRDENDNTGNSGSFRPFYTIHKFNSSGVRQWTVDLNDDTPSGASQTSNAAFTVDSSGNSYVIWTGTSGSPSFTPKSWVVRYNSSGSVSWTSPEIIAEIETQVGTTTDQQSVDLSTITKSVVVHIQVDSTGVFCWFGDGVEVGDGDYYFSGVELDASDGSFVRTYTAFDVSSSPARSDKFQCRNNGSFVLSDGSFYSAIEDGSTGDIVKNTSSELLDWSANVSHTITGARLGEGRGSAVLDPSDRLWIKGSTGLDYYAASTGTKTNLSSIGTPKHLSFKSSGNLLLTVTSLESGWTYPHQELNISGTQIREFEYGDVTGNLGMIRAMSSDEVAIATVAEIA
jgi:hypothetical protein